MDTDIAAQKALDRLAKVGFEMLSEHDKILAAIWTFEAQITYRGFRTYFLGRGGDTAYYAPTAFKAIGAGKIAGIAARANEAFGADGPPRDRKARRELVHAFGPETTSLFNALEAELYQSSEDVDELLEAYLSKQPSP